MALNSLENMVDGAETSMAKYATWNAPSADVSQVTNKGKVMVEEITRSNVGVVTEASPAPGFLDAGVEVKVGVDTTPNFLDAKTGYVELGPDSPSSLDGQNVSQLPQQDTNPEQFWPSTKGAELVPTAGALPITSESNSNIPTLTDQTAVSTIDAQTVIGDKQTNGEQDFVPMPTQEQFFEELRRMPSSERLQKAKDFLVGKLADETLSVKDRQGVEALLAQKDEVLGAFVDSQIASRFADIKQGTELVPFVAQEVQQLVDQGVIDSAQAAEVQQRAVTALKDGNGPKNKEGIKSFLISSALGMGVDINIDINSFVLAMFKAMAGQ